MLDLFPPFAFLVKIISRLFIKESVVIFLEKLAINIVSFYQISYHNSRVIWCQVPYMLSYFLEVFNLRLSLNICFHFLLYYQCLEKCKHPYMQVNNLLLDCMPLAFTTGGLPPEDCWHCHRLQATSSLHVGMDSQRH